MVAWCWVSQDWTEIAGLPDVGLNHGGLALPPSVQLESRFVEVSEQDSLFINLRSSLTLLKDELFLFEFRVSDDFSHQLHSRKIRAFHGRIEVRLCLSHLSLGLCLLRSEIALWRIHTARVLKLDSGIEPHVT